MYRTSGAYRLSSVAGSESGAIADGKSLTRGDSGVRDLDNAVPPIWEVGYLFCKHIIPFLAMALLCI